MTLDQLFDRAIPEPNSGCWLWEGATHSGGYGVAWRGGNIYAHRLSYELAVGQIPEGKQIDHKCRVRCCINPLHMEVVSLGENVRRGISFTGINYKKQFCIRGHEFTPENTAIYMRDGISPRRRCLQCYELHKMQRNKRRRDDKLRS